MAHGQPFGLLLGLVAGTIAVVAWNRFKRQADLHDDSNQKVAGWPELIAGFAAVLLATFVGGAIGAANGRILAEVRRDPFSANAYADPAYAIGAGAAEGSILACIAGLALLASVYPRARSISRDDASDADGSSDRGPSVIGYLATVAGATIVGTAGGTAIGWFVGEASRKFSLFPSQGDADALEHLVIGVVLGMSCGVLAGSALVAIFVLHHRRRSRRSATPRASS